ncbi:hypothetical protein AHAS_Ahas20G0270400 [Arachis hypogaea]
MAYNIWIDPEGIYAGIHAKRSVRDLRNLVRFCSFPTKRSRFDNNTSALLPGSNKTFLTVNSPTFTKITTGFSRFEHCDLKSDLSKEMHSMGSDTSCVLEDPSMVSMVRLMLVFEVFLACSLFVALFIVCFTRQEFEHFLYFCLESSVHGHQFGLTNVGMQLPNAAGFCQSVLVNALIEIWRLETHTFHFPVGECIVTLKDVALILSLPTSDLPVTGPTLSSFEVLEAECLDQFSVTPRKTNCRESFIKLTWFRGLKDRLVFANDIHI